MGAICSQLAPKESAMVRGSGRGKMLMSRHPGSGTKWGTREGDKIHTTRSHPKPTSCARSLTSHLAMAPPAPITLPKALTRNEHRRLVGGGHLHINHAPIKVMAHWKLHPTSSWVSMTMTPVHLLIYEQPESRDCADMTTMKFSSWNWLDAQWPLSMHREVRGPDSKSVSHGNIVLLRQRYWAPPRVLVRSP